MTIRAFALCMVLTGHTLRANYGLRQPDPHSVYGATLCEPGTVSFWPGVPWGY